MTPPNELLTELVMLTLGAGSVLLVGAVGLAAWWIRRHRVAGEPPGQAEGGGPR